MAKNKGFTINRNKYKDIKSMDHSQMNEYINGVRQVEYEKGYKIGRVEGYEAAVKENAENPTENIDLEILKLKLLEIKGIGESKATAIMDVVKEAVGNGVS